MKILAAQLRGLRSFVAPQSIRFDAMQPGLYHVAGRNEVQPELGANGAGKSSLFKGIYWTLYGQDDEGLRAGNFRNWHTKEPCEGILDLELASGRVGVFRSYSPNVLEACPFNGKPEPYDQLQFEQGLGINADAFLYSTYFAQFSPAFVDLKPAEQTALFVSVLQLEVWERAAKAASKAAQAHAASVQTWREEKARLEGQAEELLAADYAEREQLWERSQAATINALAQRVHSADVKRATSQTAAERAKAAAAKYTEWLVRASTAASEADMIEQQHVKQSHAVVALQRDDITNCPECNAPVTRAHVKKELSKAVAKLKALDDSLVKAQAKVDHAQAELAKHQAAHAAQLAAERALSTCTAELQSVQREHDSAAREANPYTKLRLEADERGEELVRQLEHARAALDTAERAVKSAEFWASRGFKEIRLEQVHASLTQLTLECNEVLFQLGLQDWAVSFDIERETQSGSISKGFTTMVSAPGAPAVPFKAYCGGEKQRVRTSVSLGFGNLICSRAGISPNLEMWDEQSRGLSGTGFDDLLLVLADRAKRYKKVILFADPGRVDAGAFAGTITIVKDKHGSRIEM